MCNTSYSNTAFLPQILNYTICLFYIVIVYWGTAHFIMCPIKQGEQHAKGNSGGKGGGVKIYLCFWGEYDSPGKKGGVTHAVLREAL